MAELAISTPAVLTDPGALESPISGRQISVEVVDRRGRIVARSLNLGARVLPEDALERAARVHGRTGAEDIELDGRPLRIYAAPIADASGRPRAGRCWWPPTLRTSPTPPRSLGVLVALTGAGVVLVAALAAAALTRRGLRPLRTLAAAAGEIEAPPTRRAGCPRRTLDEIGRLTGVLNRMLASLEEARASERRCWPTPPTSCAPR